MALIEVMNEAARPDLLFFYGWRIARGFSLLLIFPTILGYTTVFSILSIQAVKDRLEAFQA